MLIFVCFSVALICKSVESVLYSLRARLLLRAEQGLNKNWRIMLSKQNSERKETGSVDEAFRNSAAGSDRVFFFFHFGAAFGSEFGERCTEHGESMKRISVSTVSVVVAVVALLLSRESPYPSRIARRALNFWFARVFRDFDISENFEIFEKFRDFRKFWIFLMLRDFW